MDDKIEKKFIVLFLFLIFCMFALLNIRTDLREIKEAIALLQGK